MMRSGREQQQGEEAATGAAWLSLALSVVCSCGQWFGRYSILIGTIAILVVGGVVPAAEAQSSADSYFHEAAHQYVEGNTVAARRVVEEGLEKAPSDPRLIALRKKLQESGRSEGSGEQDPSSPNSGKNAQQDNSTPSDESSSDEENTSSSEEGRRTPSGMRNPSETGSTPSGARSSNRQAGAAQGRADTLGRGGRGQPVDTLSREQAERLLRALEGQERQLLRRLQTRSTERRTVEKDW